MKKASKKKTAAQPPTGQPPRATPEQILAGAIELANLLPQLGIRDRGLVADAVAQLLRDGAVYDEFDRALFLSIADAVSAAPAVTIGAALGLQAGPMTEKLAQHAALWNGFLLVWGIRQAARQGHLLVDAARALGRSMVRGAVAEEMARLDPAGRQQLTEDFREIATFEARVGGDVQAHRSEVQDLHGQAAAEVAKVNRHRGLLSALGRLADGDDLPWDEMLAAAKTLEEIEAASGAPATHAPPPIIPPAKGDRRGPSRP